MISTHILDTSKGAPAAGVKVRLQLQAGQEWTELGEGETNSDGRHVFDVEKKAGTYRLWFEIENYYRQQSTPHFFLNTPVIFRIEDTGRKYHVPLLLNPYGYSTYRGS